MWFGHFCLRHCLRKQMGQDPIYVVLLALGPYLSCTNVCNNFLISTDSMVVVYLKYYFNFHVCLIIPVVSNSSVRFFEVICLKGKVLLQVFSLYNIILFCRPRGAREYPLRGCCLAPPEGRRDLTTQG